jgi:hypothetical protein
MQQHRCGEHGVSELAASRFEFRVHSILQKEGKAIHSVRPVGMAIYFGNINCLVIKRA